MRGPLVLLVEDEALIALALMDDLEAAGYRVAGPFQRCDESFEWLQHHEPDIAIIDIHLRDGSSAGLARALREREVPFIVFSGERRDGRVPDDFAGARWLGKPAAARQVLDSIEELVTASAASRPVTVAGDTALAI